jgi:uncharacterized membrane protein YphA (DoxX/SURF4 family)
LTAVLTEGMLPLLARWLVSVIFVTSTLSKLFSWGSNVDYMTSKHLPMIPVLLAGALVIEGLGSLCLITGFAARAAASVIFIYLIPVTFLLRFYVHELSEKSRDYGRPINDCRVWSRQICVGAATHSFRHKRTRGIVSALTVSEAPRVDPSRSPPRCAFRVHESSRWRELK